MTAAATIAAPTTAGSNIAGSPVIETERLTLRRLQPRDYAAWKPFILDDRSRYMRDEGDVGEAWRDFCHALGHWEMRGWGVFAICLKGEDAAFGDVGPWMPENWNEPEIAWSIWDAAREGRGYVTEAATAARDWAFRELGWPTAVSYIDPGNARSIAVAERLGARRDDKAGHPFGEEACLVYRHPSREGTR